MKNIFIIYGSLVCFFFAFANYRGMSFVDSLDSSKWSPQGQQKVESNGRSGYRGYNRYYHK